MKENIHPKYYKTSATCACGAVFEIGTTRENLKVDICSACHPLFTGQQRILDAEGRVQKFNKKYDGLKVVKREAKKPKKKVVAATTKGKLKSKLTTKKAAETKSADKK